jgi:ribosomal protein S12 methylthiotransferase
MDSCVTEAQQLVAQGARELVLIAQDTTAYGYDLGESEGLSILIDALVSEVPGQPWIRVMYTYPQRVTQRLISKIARHPQVQKYLDLPLQHNDPDILTRMGRPPQGGADLVHNLRKRIPDIAIRTSFIVGFPGETEKEHQDMLRFMEEMAFDWAGVFMYSREEGTPAAKLPGQVPGRVKRHRYQQAMEVQQEVTRKRNAAQLGRTLPVLVESVPQRLRATGHKHSIHKLAEFRAAGRSYREAPEVDGMVLIKQIVEPGTIVPVTITDSFVYDLGGEADLTGEV